MVLSILVFLLLAAAVFYLLDLGPALAEALREKEAASRKKRKYQKQGKLRKRLTRLVARGKSLVRGSKVPRPIYALMTVGCGVGGFIAGNFIYGSRLIAVSLGVLGLFAPLLWLSFRETSSRGEDMERLAASMMILSNSYLITEDFLESVRDNMNVLEYPAPFREFAAYATYMSSDIRSALRRMEEQVKNSFFAQWVDALVLAQEDREQKYVTVSVVQSLNDALQVQRESDAAMYAVWRDYFLVLILIFAMPLVFRLLLPEAYTTMTTSLAGQGLLTLLLAAVVFSVFRALKINRPLVM